MAWEVWLEAPGVALQALTAQELLHEYTVVGGNVEKLTRAFTEVVEMVSLRDQTIQALRQEVAEWHGQAQALQAELEAVRAERDRLRAAIRRVLDSPCGMGMEDIETLHAALEGRDDA